MELVSSDHLQTIRTTDSQSPTVPLLSIAINSAPSQEASDQRDIREEMHDEKTWHSSRRNWRFGLNPRPIEPSFQIPVLWIRGWDSHWKPCFFSGTLRAHRPVRLSSTRVEMNGTKNAKVLLDYYYVEKQQSRQVSVEIHTKAEEAPMQSLYHRYLVIDTVTKVLLVYSNIVSCARFTRAALSWKREEHGRMQGTKVCFCILRVISHRFPPE